jgi:hypothetical protein
LVAVDLSRLLIVTGVLVATVSSASDDVAAQGLNNEASAFESAWTSGYMGLGGGLIRAMPMTRRKEKAEAPPRPSHKRYVHAQPRIYEANSPASFVANTLDQTGLNIANVGVHAGAR